MPLDDLSTGSSTAQPLNLQSSNFGSAISNTIQKELPGALAKSKQQSATLQTASQQTIDELEQDRARRATLQAPVPPAPQKPPEFHATPANEQWGSVAMGFAMLASAFTKRPMVNALNAGAKVMEAYHAKDADAYKRSFEQWKVENEYAAKLYDYQRDAYKDAIESITSDEKGALSKLRVLASALGDDPMHRLAQAGNVAGVISLEDQRRVSMDETKARTTKLLREGEATGNVLSGMKAFQEAKSLPDTDPEKPAKVAAATEQLQQAQQVAQALKASESTAVPHYDQSQNFQILDKDGKVVDRILGRESTTKPGEIVRTDTGQPVRLEAGQTIQKATATEGRQSAQQVQRLVGATSEMVPALKNLVELPIDATAGAFMGLQAVRPEALKDAVARVGATHLVGEAAIAVNQQFTGINRALAIIESQGAAAGLVGLQKGNENLVPQSGWSGTAVMRSYAEIRQIIEQNIKAMQASPYVSASQKEFLSQAGKDIEEVVPWTVHDVNELAFGNKKKFRESVSAFADKVLARRKETETKPAAAPPAAGAAPAATGMPTISDKAAYDALPDGTRYRGPDGKEYVKGQQ